MTAYNNSSGLTVHRLHADGAIGARVAQDPNLDTGIYARQILATPSNRCVTLVTRGNNAAPDKPEDPGAIKTFAFDNGVLRNLASIAPGDGLGFGPRHLDFHPSRPWAFLSIERQNKLYVYALDDATGLKREPLFVKETLSNPKSPPSQGAGPIHVHPSGRFVYLTNRTFPAVSDGVRQFSARVKTTLSCSRSIGTAASRKRSSISTAAAFSYALPAAIRAAVFFGRREHHAVAAARRSELAGGNDSISHRRGRDAHFRAQIRRRCRKRAAILERNGHAAINAARKCRTDGPKPRSWVELPRRERRLKHLLFLNA